jgi:TatD DNase family protein
MPDFIDTHAHIHEGFGDVDDVIARARDAGVVRILTLGVNRRDSADAIALAERHDCVLAAAGVHPHDAKDATDADLDALEEMVAHPCVAVVGEIGLDYYRNLSPADVQQRVLRRQLETAARVQKPVAVHARDAHADVLPMLEAWSRKMGGELRDGRPLGVLHYFAGDAAQAARYVELGYLISVHTSVTHPKGEALRDVVRAIGVESLVIETDSPYGAPQRVRGKRNEPAYVVDAAQQVADVLGLPIERVAGVTSRNAIRLLGPAAAL